MALPLLVLPSGFCSGGGTESLDIAVTEDGEDESGCWSELCRKRLVRR